MLERPNLSEEIILLCLTKEFGIINPRIEFLPLGADINTAVYRVMTQSNTCYFLKLRSGKFSEPSVLLPAYIFAHGIREIIPPIPTQSQKLWANLEAFHAVLYPYVEGKDGYEVDLSDDQLRTFGKAVKSIHQLDIPQQIQRKIPSETFSIKWNNRLSKYIQILDGGKLYNSFSKNLTESIFAQKDIISKLITRTEQLSSVLVNRPLQFVICHSDLHAGNLLVDHQKNLHIVDWDTLLRAPKERDLMYIGGGQGFRGHTLIEEVDLFYQGYGETEIDQEALSYYRFTRIIEDLAVECRIILSKKQPIEDRIRELEFFKSNFVPNGVVEIARQQDRALLNS